MSSPNKRLISWFTMHPVFSGLLVTGLVLFMGAVLTYQRYLIWQNEERKSATQLVENARSRLQQSLQYSQAATLTLAFSLRDGKIPDEIDSISEALLRNNRYIDALQLVPGGIIRYVYPLKGNENVIGYNILADPTRNQEAFKAREQRKLYFAGPFALRQGGMGVVGRLPVFTPNGFWGFSAVIIRLETLLEAAGIDTSGANGFYYQLSKINPSTGVEEFFLPVKTGSGNTINATVQVSDGEWKLSVSPVAQALPFRRIVPTSVLVLLFALLAGFTTMFMLRRPAELEKLVAQRTEELDRSLERNKAIINALPDTLFIIDADNRFSDYINPQGHQTYLPPTQFIHKKIEEVMPPELVTQFLAIKAEVLRDKKVITYYYQLPLQGNNRDYEAHCTFYGKKEVLVLVRDITERIKTEKELRQSREEFRQLSNYLENIREEERVHIAREIHDELGQQLTVLKMDLARLGKAGAPDDKFEQDKKEIMLLINDIVATVRKISSELRPSLLDDLGLVAAMDWYCRDFMKRTGVQTHFSSPLNDKDIPGKLTTGLFRILQESLTNVARHAGATEVRISLDRQNGQVQLRVTDNGKGFKKDEIRSRKTLGLLGMQERAAMMQGSYRVESSPGKGTITTVLVPVEVNAG